MKHKITVLLIYLGSIGILAIFAACGGGGGGGGDEGVTIPSSYDGVTSQATVTTVNVSNLIETAWESSHTGPDIGESFPDIDDSGILVGDCGGTATIALTVDGASGKFNGTILFSGYCTAGTTLDGTISYDGEDNEDNMVFKINFDDLNVGEDSESYTLTEGYVRYVVKQDLSGESITFDLVLRDNSNQKTYWLNDYTIEFTSAGLEDTVIITGQFYDYDYGYVDITTETPLVIVDAGPTSGALLFTGMKSSARLTFTSNLSTLLELDANGDGNFVPVNLLEFTLARQFLQFITFENSANDRFSAFVSYKVNGELLEPGELSTARIYDPSDNELNATPQFISNSYTAAAWNPSLSLFTGVGIDGDSGYSFNLGNDADLAAGTYHFEVETTNGTLLTSSVEFPGKLALPTVAASGMSFQWNPDDSLTLSWIEPVGSFQQYRIVFADQDGQNIFFARVLPGVSQVTLQSALVTQITTLSAPNQVNWTMQTRNYVGNENFARGCSNPVPINW